MSGELVYVIDSHRAPGLLGSAGVSFELVIPRPNLKLNPEEVAGKIVWVIVKRDGVLYLTVQGFTSGLAEIDGAEEADNGDFLLELDRWRTFKTISPDGDRGRWVVEDEGYALGSLGFCPPGIAEELSEKIRSSYSVRLVGYHPKPNARNWSTLSGVLPLGEALAKAVRSRSLDQMATYRALLPLSPLGAEVLSSFFAVGDEESAALLVAVMAIDPLSSAVEASVPYPVLRFDADLRPLDPGKVFARRYLPGRKLLDIQMSLEATAQAERFHQNIVRRLARGFEALGIQPLASNSVDLAFKNGIGTEIVEVKTATHSNLIAQFLRGVSQILYYEAELKLADGGSYYSHLVLGHEGGISILPPLDRTAFRANISLAAFSIDPTSEGPLLEEARAIVEAARRRIGV